MKFRKKPVVIEATQWFKNGDHPNDYDRDHDGLEGGELRVFTGAERKANGWEGDVVRYFRTPDIPSDVLCTCGNVMLYHGWIDTLEGGHIVCPGDWIIIGVKGERYPCKPDIFEATYDRVHPKNDSPAMEAVTQALQQVRMLIIQQITNLAASPAYELAREVLPEYSPFIRVKLSTLALHAYCDDIIKNRITLPDDSYEPHALYFRTFIVDRLRMLRPYIQEVERPA